MSYTITLNLYYKMLFNVVNRNSSYSGRFLKRNCDYNSLIYTRINIDDVEKKL